MVSIAVIVFLLGALTLAFFTASTSAHREAVGASDELHAHYLAETAVSEAIAVLRAQGRPALEAKAYPVDLGGATYDLVAVWGDADADLDDDLVRLVGIGMHRGERASVEATVRLAAPPEEDSPYGIVGKNSLTFLSNAVIDSYDSTKGTYASQAIHSWNGWPYANSAAPVASNGGISMDSNSSVRGDAHPGPSSTVSLSGGSIVSGSTTPLAEPVTVAPVTVPVLPSSGNINKSSGSLVIPPGDRRYGSFTATSVATITIQGPANVVIKDFKLDSNAKLRIDSTNGPVAIYVTGKFEQLSNTTFGPINGLPKDLQLYMSASSPDPLFDSNPSFTGLIHAPDRKLMFKSNAQAYGSVVAHRITLDSNAKLHFDESLIAGGGEGATEEVELLCWRRAAEID